MTRRIGQGAVFCPPASAFQARDSSSTSFTLVIAVCGDPAVRRASAARRYPAGAFLSSSPHFILAFMKTSIERAASAVIGYRETRDPLDRVRYRHDFLQHTTALRDLDLSLFGNPGVGA